MPIIQFGQIITPNPAPGIKGTIQQNFNLYEPLNKTNFEGKLDAQDVFTGTFKDAEQRREANVLISPWTQREDGLQTREFRVSVAYDPKKTISAMGLSSGHETDTVPFNLFNTTKILEQSNSLLQQLQKTLKQTS